MLSELRLTCREARTDPSLALRDPGPSFAEKNFWPPCLCLSMPRGAICSAITCWPARRLPSAEFRFLPNTQFARAESKLTKNGGVTGVSLLEPVNQREQPQSELFGESPVRCSLIWKRKNS